MTNRITLLMTATLFAVTSIFMSGCSGIKTTNDDEFINKRDRHYAGYGKFFGEEALLFGDSKDTGKKPDVGIGVNTFLWRATLDTLSFMPLQSVDPFGGVIITSWYEDPDLLKSKKQRERLKINVRIMDRVLRADGLTVSVFREVRQGGAWVTATVDPKTAENLEDAILMRARQLKSNQ